MVSKFLSKPNVEIEVQSQNELIPGTSLPAEVQLTAQEQIEARQVRLELIGTETYYERQTSHDSRGRTSTRTVRRHGTINRIIETVSEEQTFLPGEIKRWQASLQLPSDTPPTCRGKLVDIHWTLRAVLDVPKRRDQSQEVPVHILCQPP